MTTKTVDALAPKKARKPYRQRVIIYRDVPPLPPPRVTPYVELSPLDRAHADEQMALMLSHLVEHRMREAIQFAHSMNVHIEEFKRQAAKNRAEASPSTTSDRQEDK